jgi:hypothetical protein
MNLKVLDGFSRVDKTMGNLEMNGNKSRRKAKRNARRTGTKSNAAQQRTGTKFNAAQRKKELATEILERAPGDRVRMKREIKSDKSKGMKRTGSALPTKRAKQKSRSSSINQMAMGQTEGSIRTAKSKTKAVSNPGFSTIYVDNVPGRKSLQGYGRVVYERAMQGFGRRRYSRQQLQGLSTDGMEILQGYALGDAQDMEEWSYLVNLEHPVVLEGFPAFVLNGKRKDKRKERRARRQTKRSDKRGRKEAKNIRKEREREAKTARKEEKFLRKKQKREQKLLNQEARRARKQQRIDDRAEKKAQRQEARTERQRLRTEGRAGRQPFFDQMAEFAGDSGLTEALFDIAGGGGGQFDYDTISDFDLGPLSEFGDEMSLYDAEDALDIRDEYLDEEYEDSLTRGAEGAGAAAGPAGEKGSMIIPLLVVAGIGIAAASTGKKKKKKRA